MTLQHVCDVPLSCVFHVGHENSVYNLIQISSFFIFLVLTEYQIDQTVFLFQMSVITAACIFILQLQDHNIFLPPTIPSFTEGLGFKLSTWTHF